MSSTQKKAPLIGTIFSSDSSDEERGRLSGSASARETIPKKKISLRVNINSDGARSASENASKATPNTITIPSVSPDGYSAIDKSRLQFIRPNTLIQYEKKDGKFIKNKYFKKNDTIAGTVVVGFYTHGKRNYSESLDNIKTIFVQEGVNGGADPLKETIEVPQDQWKTLRRDMIISYEKDSGEFIYRAKFNAVHKGADGSSRMSLTSERGYNYIANPSKIAKIYRHVTGNDKTLTFILEALRKLEMRVRQLEMKKNKTQS